MVRRYRSAFTLVELMVVIAIIAMLMGMVFPAIQGAREAGRRNTCASNMRQVGLAMQNYESRPGGSFPGYKTYLRLDDGTEYRARGEPYPENLIGQPSAVTWLVELLPFMDAKATYDAFRKPVNTGGSGGGTGGGGGTAGATASQATGGGGSTFIQNVYVYLDNLVCPSDPPPSQDRAPTSIVVNTGMRDGTTVGQRDFRANGVFHDHYTDNPSTTANRGGGATNLRTEKVDSAFIGRGDGLTYTLLLSENVDAGSYLDTDERFVGFTWAKPTTAVDFSGSVPFGLPPQNFQNINQGTERIKSLIEDPSFQSSGGTAGSGGSGDSGGSTAGATASQAGGGSSGGFEDDGSQYYFYARPSSNHPKGVNVVFADGHTTFLDEGINYYVYVLLMTPQGSQVRDPKNNGTAISEPGFNNTNQPPPVFDAKWLVP